MPEIFVFQRAFRAKTKGSCWLLKPGTCSSKRLARVCYLKLQKTAKNGRFAVSPAPCAVNADSLSLSFSAPLPRRGHRSQFILPTPLPGGRYSLRLAIPSSLCLSYHSARPELQCGHPPFTAQPPCARRRRHRAVETLLSCLGCILFSQKSLSHFRISHISNRLFFLGFKIQA